MAHGCQNHAISLLVWVHSEGNVPQWQAETFSTSSVMIAPELDLHTRRVTTGMDFLSLAPQDTKHRDVLCTCLEAIFVV